MAYLTPHDKLGENQLKRSIVVSNIPDKTSYRDVIIYFQKECNGGGEVISVSYLKHEDPSVLIVTFERDESK